ncbi:hypothetical protein [Zunongwangia pacifica]|uniref:Uncharacterized protein n=1 Tax=Zunongwangia pacifica TaxID=2911062 RepID=A0A9X2CJJ1_9FLAO|nr:hypothetical protein [Zunongwangia pacifica]MCL6217861.1 hypothetical protein [Zunongwangia pacifica]
MRKVLLIALICIGFQLEAQDLGEFKPLIDKFKLNKFAAANNRIYINKFNVNFQLYNEMINHKSGGKMWRGGVKGDATARLAVGLQGISEADLQQTVDKLYEEFVSDLKAKGFTIVTALEAGKTKYYQDWMPAKGGNIEVSNIPGVVSVSPTGYEYYFKANKDGGKRKQNMFSQFSKIGENTSLSKELNDAIIATIDLTIAFVELGDNWNPTGAAKIKIKPNLRLVDSYAITNENKSKSIIKFKGSVTHDQVTSEVNFISGKSGPNPTASYKGSLKKSLEIENVVNEDKIVSVVAQDVDKIGKELPYFRLYSAENKSVEDLQVINVESTKYANGVYMACKKMLMEHTTNALKSI